MEIIFTGEYRWKDALKILEEKRGSLLLQKVVELGAIAAVILENGEEWRLDSRSMGPMRKDFIFNLKEVSIKDVVLNLLPDLDKFGPVALTLDSLTALESHPAVKRVGVVDGEGLCHRQWRDLDMSKVREVEVVPVKGDNFLFSPLTGRSVTLPAHPVRAMEAISHFRDGEEERLEAMRIAAEQGEEVVTCVGCNVEAPREHFNFDGHCVACAKEQEAYDISSGECTRCKGGQGCIYC